MKTFKPKSQKREEQARKIRIKEKKGATLSSQILRTKTAGKYKGEVKKMVKN